MIGGYDPFTSKRDYPEFAVRYKKTDEIDVYNIDKLEHDVEPSGGFNFKFVSNVDKSANEIGNLIMSDQEEFTIETKDFVGNLDRGDFLKISESIEEINGIYFIENVQKKVIGKTTQVSKYASYITTISIRR